MWDFKGAIFPPCRLIFLPFLPPRLMSPEHTLLQPREEEGVKYERTFMASEFLDWLVQEGEATTRKEAEQLCHRLMEHGIIQHGECAGRLPPRSWTTLKSCGLRRHVCDSPSWVCCSSARAWAPLSLSPNWAQVQLRWPCVLVLGPRLKEHLLPGIYCSYR